MTGRKERKKKIQFRLWDSNPQSLACMDKGTTTCAKGEPEVVGRGVVLILWKSTAIAPKRARTD